MTLSGLACPYLSHNASVHTDDCQLINLRAASAMPSGDIP